MRATLFASLAVVIATSACGVDTFGDGGDAGQVGTVSGSAPPGCDVTKLPTDDTCVIDEAVGLFVSSSHGSATADGSRAHPFASLGAGIVAASKAHKRVYACAETYAEQVQLAGGTSVFGYFQCNAGWAVGDGHAQVKSPASPAVTATNVNVATRIEAVDIVAPDFTTGGQSSIGLLATSSAALDIVHAKIHAGTGGAGDDGVDGIQLADSGSGKNGQTTWTEGVSTGKSVADSAAQPPVGGANACSGASGHDGGPGGAGGTGGEWFSTGFNWSAMTAAAAGNPSSPTTQTALGGSVGGAGSNGASGGNGASGSNGSSFGALSASGYSPSDGAAGTDGQPGQGGGGSGGVALSATDYPPGKYGSFYGWGEPGPGGGAGGCPGLAATAGRGGGASIAIVAIQSAFKLDTVVVESSGGGSGGTAGAPSTLSTGGVGGSSASKTFAGGSGGSGGMAGVSGNGGGGPSIGIAYQGTEPTLSASTVTQGAAGSGVGARTVHGQTIPASSNGVSQAAYSF